MQQIEPIGPFMQRITIELLHERALQLIHQLEQLHLVRLIPESPAVTAPQQPGKWGGSISRQTAISLLQKLDESREEWERFT
jgi:hypothetical protein